jgi:phage tail sheath protein FI
METGALPDQHLSKRLMYNLVGFTMTPTDILNGKMLITVKVAIVRPAKFIVITFQQKNAKK